MIIPVTTVKNNTEIFINDNKIVHIKQYNDHTKIFLDDGGYLSVKEEAQELAKLINSFL